MVCGCDFAHLATCLWKEGEPHRQLMYDLEKNFNELKNVRTRLRDKTDVRNRAISNAEDEGSLAPETLTGWIRRVEEMEAKLESILGQENNLNQLPEECLGGCCYVKCLSAYKLAKRIAETLPQAEALIKESLEQSEAFAPAPLDDLPVDQTFGMDNKVNEVWQHIDEPTPRIIRICGMGGVGKTALMKQAHNEFLTRKHAFDVIIWVDASNSSDVHNIQLALGVKLGFNWSTNTKEHARATNIKMSLKKRSFVLFIDDPHRDLKLTNVGIPVHDNPKNFKVIFSTRDEAVCLGLGGSQYLNIDVQLLPWKDAWDLFQQAVGEEALPISDPQRTKNVAENVARLCGNLPLTLVTVGRAMSSKKYLKDWTHAEEMLKNFDPEFVYLNKEVYERFHVSYDGLSPAAQSCFLYCSLFPRDYSVRKDELLDYWLGENFLTEAPALKTIRSQGESIFSALNAAYLLEKGEDDNILRMHDTIHGYALWMATGCGKRKGAVWANSGIKLSEFPSKDLDWRNVERISLVQSEINKVSRIAGKCSRLATLILRDVKFKEISDGFFQAMSFLKVLDLSRCDIIMFPSEITLLTELQYLNMSRTHIADLPSDLKKLTKLKFLDLSFIPFPLSRSFRLLWGGAGQTLFQELESLIHLQDLGISVNGYEALQSLWYSTKFDSIQSLFITKCQGAPLSFNDMENLKILRVFDCPQLEDLQMINCFASLCHVEVDSCWALSNLTWLQNASNLQSLKVVNCIKVTAIISDSGSNAGAGPEQNNPFFPCLKSIYLNNLPELKMIYENTLHFPCLEEIEVHSCPNLYELPLDINSTHKTLKAIKGHENWWRNLVWKQDGDIKKFSHTYFRVQIE